MCWSESTASEPFMRLLKKASRKQVSLIQKVILAQFLLQCTTDNEAFSLQSDNLNSFVLLWQHPHWRFRHR